MCGDCDWAFPLVGRNGFLGRWKRSRRFWSVVSSSGRIFHTGCVSGCPLSVKRCIQEPERTGWSGLWISSVHYITVAGIAPMVDFSGITKTIEQVGVFSLPKLVFFTSHKPIFDLGAFFTIAIVFLVSAAETTGATTAVCTGALGRDIKMEELQGSLAVDGFSSAISGCFGCLPLTSFSQNIGLVTMTGVINRFTILMGALILILASLFPPLGAFFNSLPQAVLGGCTVMMFGSIMYEGIKMLKECVFDDRTMIIVSLAFCIGVGLTQTSGNFFSAFPKEVGDIFNGNAVAGVFVVSLILSLCLPKKKTTNL